MTSTKEKKPQTIEKKDSEELQVKLKDSTAVPSKPAKSHMDQKDHSTNTSKSNTQNCIPNSDSATT